MLLLAVWHPSSPKPQPPATKPRTGFKELIRKDWQDVKDRWNEIEAEQKERKEKLEREGAVPKK
jgi:hypothetical protein